MRTRLPRALAAIAAIAAAVGCAAQPTPDEQEHEPTAIVWIAAHDGPSGPLACGPAVFSVRPR